MGGVQLGWLAYVNGEMSFQSKGEIGKVFCPNFLQPFPENIDRRSYVFKNIGLARFTKAELTFYFGSALLRKDARF